MTSSEKLRREKKNQGFAPSFLKESQPSHSGK